MIILYAYLIVEKNYFIFMNKYDKHIIDALNFIKNDNLEINLSFLGKTLKKYLLKNNIIFYLKKKRISLNTYLRLRYKGLMNFIKLNTTYSILNKENNKLINFS